jgi:hypothetical protein
VGAPPAPHLLRRALQQGRRPGVPYCGHVRVKSGFNDLQTIAPQIASEWDTNRNLDLSPQDAGPGSGRKVWWICHSYEQVIAARIRGSGCPHCSNGRLLPGQNDLQSRFPRLAAEWHPTKNCSLNPSLVVPGNQERWWLYPAGHGQLQTVPNRSKAHGCSKCPMENRGLHPHTDNGAPPSGEPQGPKRLGPE